MMSVMDNVKREIVEIERSEIVIDDEFNARKIVVEDTEEDDLDASLKAEGQLEPVIIWKPDDSDRFRLVAGFRRYAALGRIGKETVLAREYVGDEEGAVLVNLVENTARKNLQKWEIADRAKILRDKYGMSDGEIAEKLGKSRGYVSGLLRVVDYVDPSILEDWRSGDKRASTNVLIRKIAPISSREEQKMKWAEMGPLGKPIPSSVTASDEERARKFPSKKRIEAVLTNIDMVEQDPQWRAGAAAALEFVLGMRPSLEGVEEAA